MAQDLLTRIHRWSRALAPKLGPLRGLARGAFRFALRLRYPEDQLMRATQNGRSWLLVPEVALRGEQQEYETIRWLGQVVRPGMCVFDIGANVGQMTMEAAVLAGPSGRVIAIEPGPGNLKVLRRHLEANGLSSRVTVVDAASTERHGGVVRLFVGGDSADAVGSGHTLAGAEALKKVTANIGVHPRDVRAVSVDGLCAELGVKPAVLKIDVEGAELHVLRGALETLRGARPVVRVGFHPFAFDDVVAASDELRQLFKAADYEFQAPGSGALELDEYVALPR